MHPVHGLVLEQQLVVFGNGHEEKDGCDVLKAVNPLLSLGSLTADVEHTVSEITNDESCLGNTRRLDTRSEHVLVVGQVVGGGNSGNVIKVTAIRR